MSINGLEITEVKIHRNDLEAGTTHLIALARVVLNGCFCINNIRVVRGKFGPFIAFPSMYDKKTGTGWQYCHPITKALQEYLATRILREFHQVQEAET